MRKYPKYHEWAHGNRRFSCSIHWNLKSMKREHWQVYHRKDRGVLGGFCTGPSVSKDGKHYAADIHLRRGWIFPYVVIHECVHAAMCVCRSKYERLDPLKNWRHEEAIAQWAHKIWRHLNREMNDHRLWTGMEKMERGKRK